MLDIVISFFFFFFIFLFLEPHLWRKEILGLGVELELQLPAYATATATRDPSRICDLHHSSCQRWILNPLIEVRDQTHILMDTTWILNLLNHSRISSEVFFSFFFFFLIIFIF